jgi:hypothetical protein
VPRSCSYVMSFRSRYTDSESQALYNDKEIKVRSTCAIPTAARLLSESVST